MKNIQQNHTGGGGGWGVLGWRLRTVVLWRGGGCGEGGGGVGRVGGAGGGGNEWAGGGDVLVSHYCHDSQPLASSFAISPSKKKHS